jgi:hypothetical protein
MTSDRLRSAIDLNHPDTAGLDCRGGGRLLRGGALLLFGRRRDRLFGIVPGSLGGDARREAPVSNRRDAAAPAGERGHLLSDRTYPRPLANPSRSSRHGGFSPTKVKVPCDYYAAFIIDPDGYRIEAYYGPGET